jgi:DNA-binding NtrC family response regulator
VNLLVDRAAKSERTPVLISGELGTGKELVAEAIHRMSGRARMPFRVVSCSTSSAGSLENELFGIEVESGPGSRHTRKGVLELAEGGTVLIKDLDRLPMHLQERLIPVVTEGRLQRINGRNSRPTSVRIIACSTEDLPMLAAKGQFNSAFLVALAGFHIHIAPLRERPEDIAALAQEFAENFARDLGCPVPVLPADTIASMSRYQWPGNTLELRNVVERIVLLSQGRPVHLSVESLQQLSLSAFNEGDLRERESDFRGSSGSRARPSRGRVPSQTIDSSSVRFPNPWLVKDILPLEEVERAYIARTLELVRQNRTIAARKLGISRSTLQRKLQAYGMDTEENLVTQSPD